MSDPVCACGRILTEKDRMGASAYACSACGRTFRPEPASPPPPLPPPAEKQRPWRPWLLLRGILVLGIFISIPVGLWKFAKYGMDHAAPRAFVPEGPKYPT